MERPNKALSLEEYVEKARLETKLRREKQAEHEELKKRQAEAEEFIRNEQEKFREQSLLRHEKYNEKESKRQEDILKSMNAGKSPAQEEQARLAKSEQRQDKLQIRNEYIKER